MPYSSPTIPGFGDGSSQTHTDLVLGGSSGEVPGHLDSHDPYIRVCSSEDRKIEFLKLEVRHGSPSKFALYDQHTLVAGRPGDPGDKVVRLADSEPTAILELEPLAMDRRGTEECAQPGLVAQPLELAAGEPSWRTDLGGGRSSPFERPDDPVLGRTLKHHGRA